MNDQKNTLLAIVLSAMVLIVWQIFVGLPQMEKQKQGPARRQHQQEPGQPPAPAPGTPPQGPVQTPPGAPQVPGQPAAVPTLTREQILAQIPAHQDRDAAASPARSRSRAARIDDLSLTHYRETVDPKSPPIVLLAPSGSAAPVLRRVRLVAARRHHAEAARPRHGLAAGQAPARSTPTGR